MYLKTTTLKHCDNEFELCLVDRDPQHVLLTTRFNKSGPDYLDCDWGFNLKEFQEFVDFINRFNEGFRDD